MAIDIIARGLAASLGGADIDLAALEARVKAIEDAPYATQAYVEEIIGGIENGSY